MAISDNEIRNDNKKKYIIRYMYVNENQKYKWNDERILLKWTRIEMLSYTELSLFWLMFCEEIRISFYGFFFLHSSTFSASKCFASFYYIDYVSSGSIW